MTRVNVGILPQELSDKHLLAEHREIKRIPNVITRGRYTLDGQPKKFKLGEGHVKFFYDKLLYLKKRYEQLYEECLRRKFNVQYYGDAWDKVPIELMDDYHPTNRDREIVLQRIKEKLQK